MFTIYKEIQKILHKWWEDNSHLTLFVWFGCPTFRASFGQRVAFLFESCFLIRILKNLMKNIILVLYWLGLLYYLIHSQKITLSSPDILKAKLSLLKFLHPWNTSHCRIFQQSSSPKNSSSPQLQEWRIEEEGGGSTQRPGNLLW